MLIPKKTKYRKMQKGRSRKRQVETRGVEMNFGSFGLKAMDNAWLTSRQLDSARRAIGRVFKKGGKVWLRVFPDKPITRKPAEVTMGGGKGNVEYYVAPIRRGRIIFEIDGVTETIALEALKFAQDKLPIKTLIIKK